MFIVSTTIKLKEEELVIKTLITRSYCACAKGVVWYLKSIKKSFLRMQKLIIIMAP